jgi:protein-disulfide isomerase
MKDYKPFVAIGAVLLAALGIIGYAIKSNSDGPFTGNTPPANKTTTTTAATPAGTPFITLPARTRGDKAAAVLVEEFGDYQCPACAGLFEEMKKIEAEYEGKIRFSFSHFPIVARHPYAMLAGRAAEAAGMQGKFWEMHDKLYENQKDWGFIGKDEKPAKTEPEVRQLLIGYATELKLNVEKFKTDLDSPEAEKQIISDQRRGMARSVAGTPTLFMSSPQRSPSQLKPDMMTSDGIRKALDFIIQESGGTPPSVKKDDKSGK